MNGTEERGLGGRGGVRSPLRLVCREISSAIGDEREAAYGVCGLQVSQLHFLLFTSFVVILLSQFRFQHGRPMTLSVPVLGCIRDCLPHPPSPNETKCGSRPSFHRRIDGIRIVPRPRVDDAFQHLLFSPSMPAFSTGGLFVTLPFLFKILKQQ